MTEDAMYVESLRRQCHTRADRTAAMLPQQLANLRGYDIVAAYTALEHAELVLHLFGTVDRDGNADFIFDKPLDDLGAQKCGVGGEAEIDLFVEFLSAADRVSQRRFEHGKIQEGLATEESEMHEAVLARLPKHEVDAL